MEQVDRNRQLVMRYFDIVSGRRTDLNLEDCFSADARWHVPASNPMIHPNPKCGSSGVAIYQPDTLDICVESVIADAENVAVQFTLRAKLASGAPYENRYFFRFRLDGDRIAEVWEYLDTLHQQRQGAFAGH